MDKVDWNADEPSLAENDETPPLLDTESAGFLTDDEDDEASSETEEMPSEDEPEQIREETESGDRVESAARRLEEGPHSVEQGECLADIAFRSGHPPEEIWRYGRNAELRGKRTDPAFLLPGDTVYIPPLEPRWFTITTGRRHKFVAKRVTAKVELRPLFLGAPRTGARFVLEVDGSRIEGKTDAGGWVRASIPPSARRGRLTVEASEPIDVFFGHIDPVEEVTGVQARLSNLGYDCALSGELDDETREVVEVFQEDHGLEVTGQLDDATRSKLIALHGS